MNKLEQLFKTKVRHPFTTIFLTLLLIYTIRMGNFSFSPEFDELKKDLDDELDEITNFKQIMPTIDVSIQSTPTPMYVIVTTNNVEANSTELSNFIRYKEFLGFNVTLITEDEYGSAQGQTRAINIRSWLKNNSDSLNIEYALLIGNPDPDNPDTADSYGDLPMLTCFPRNGSVDGYDKSFTDYFYADLTGDWDSDNDNHFGEFGTNSIPEDGGVDFEPEIYVGRIPVYNNNYSAVDKILYNIRSHHNQSYIAKQNILIPMAISNYLNEDSSGNPVTDGRNFPEELYWHVLKDLGMNDTVLYERTGLNAVPTTAFHYSGDINASSFQQHFNLGQGAVIWWGHGSDTGAFCKYWNSDDGDSVPEPGEMAWESFINSSAVSSLEIDTPAFIYQSSCNNGNPETTNNLGYSLLESGAAISTVSASQVSWYAMGEWNKTYWNDYSDNTGLGYKYMEYLLKEGLPAGKALFNAKWNGGENWQGHSWMNKMDFNLYGDPQLNYWGSEKPQIFNRSPQFNQSEVAANGDLEVFIEDSDSDYVTVTFLNASDHTIINRIENHPNGTIASTNWQGLKNDCVYEWYVAVGDSQSYIISDTWNFTTYHEPIPPQWEELPTDQFFELGSTWQYDLNASDHAGISTYMVNNTDLFSIDNTGLLLPNYEIEVGLYHILVTVNDTNGYTTTAYLKIQIRDTTSPVWIESVTSVEFNYSIPISIQFQAEDESNISYSVNDTDHFSVNHEGLLSNITILEPGEYWIIINATDTFGNVKSLLVEITILPSEKQEIEEQPILFFGTIGMITLSVVMILLLSKRK